MAVIETKFSVGDVVWYANTTATKHQRSCPDCLGTRKWQATSPAGGTFEVECPRCSAGYQGNHALSLDYSQWTPLARRLTIGQVTASTAIGDSYDAGHRYMCHETGVGSGSVYREHDLFETEAEALATAETRAKVQNAEAGGWIAKRYAETARFCDYQLKDAAIEAADRQSREHHHAVQYLLEDIEGAYDLGEVKASIERFRERATSGAFDDLAGPLRGLLGLCTLLLARDDLPPDVRESLASNHRVVAAKTILANVEAARAAPAEEAA